MFVLSGEFWILFKCDFLSPAADFWLLYTSGGRAESFCRAGAALGGWERKEGGKVPVPRAGTLHCTVSWQGVKSLFTMQSLHTSLFYFAFLLVPAVWPDKASLCWITQLPPLPAACLLSSLLSPIFSWARYILSFCVHIFVHPLWLPRLSCIQWLHQFPDVYLHIYISTPQDSLPSPLL